MTTLRIKVTKDVIEKSKYCSADAGVSITNCPIALAIRCIFPNAEVLYKFIKVYLGDGQYKLIDLPLKATAFIKDFDTANLEQRLAMDEIEFEVEVPDEIINRISLEELKPLLVNHPTLEIVN